MKSLPCLLYRSPGPHKLPGLNPPSYDYIGAATEEEYHRHIANGWLESRDDAIGKVGAAKVIEAADDMADAVEEVSEQTRDELEAQARALGVRFNWKTSDKALAERIAAKDEQ